MLVEGKHREGRGEKRKKERERRTCSDNAWHQTALAQVKAPVPVVVVEIVEEVEVVVVVVSLRQTEKNEELKASMR